MNKRLKLFELLKKESETLFLGSHNVHTPKKLTDGMISNLNIKTNILVAYNVEIVISLIETFNIDPSNITFYSDHINKSKLMELFKVNYVEELNSNMKFDAIIANPPYKGQSMLHQKFFNKAVTLLKDNGQLVCLQPATVYFNKKDKTDDYSQAMRDNIKKYHVKVEMANPNLFENAKNRNDISITTLTKTSASDTISSVTYRSGKTFSNATLESVNRTELDPAIYSSIVEKYKKLIQQNGSIVDIVTKDKSIAKAKLASMRGNGGGDDWYTFIPANSKYHVTSNKQGDWGVSTSTHEEAMNVYNYFTTNFARFGLSIYKFSSDMYGGAMNGVPVVDFTKTYTDDELYNIAGFTQQERDSINFSLPDYHGKYTTHN